MYLQLKYSSVITVSCYISQFNIENGPSQLDIILYQINPLVTLVHRNNIGTSEMRKQ